MNNQVMTLSQDEMLELLATNDNCNTRNDLNFDNIPTIDSVSCGSSFDYFDNLIGLDAPKQYIKKMISYFEVRHIAEQRGKTTGNITRNLCFVGNPGTAKTTVARIYAKILSDKGIIKNNKFIECSRADIVSKYVGHTAKNVKTIVSKAKGGVLFIDEAYSLVENSEGGFGDEAINALVTEIENNRSNLTIIIAGYPEKMRQFLDSNPGLKSRFPYTINFPDYSVEELYRISEKIAAENGYTFDPNVHDKLIKIFQKAISVKDYGNGRYARNVVEQAELNKAVHLSGKYNNLNELSDNQLFTLSEAEFEEIEFIENRKSDFKFGFCVNS